MSTLTGASRLPLNVTEADVFDTLDDYSLLDILERLTSADMVTIASVSRRVSRLIWDYKLIPGLGKENPLVRLSISAQYTTLLFPTTSTELGWTTSFIEPDHIFAALRAFCQFFGQLDFDLDYYTRRSIDFTRQAVDHVNRHCVTVPQKMTIMQAIDSIGMFTAQHVASVTIHSPEKLGNFSFHEHFPRVQRLSILINKPFGIGERLPHLQHLELLDSSCGHFDVDTFAKWNPHIRSAKLDLCEGLHNVQLVNEAFPELMTFHYKPKWNAGYGVLRAPDEEEEAAQSVHFRNVKSYTIDLLDYERQQRDLAAYAKAVDQFASITFDGLQSLEYITLMGNRSAVDPVEFIGQYKGVTRLDFSTCEVSYGDVRRLIDALPNLREIKIRPNDDREQYLRLMAETGLETIRVRVNAESMDEFQRYTLPAKWYLQTPEYTPLRFRILTFKRNKM